MRGKPVVIQGKVGCRPAGFVAYAVGGIFGEGIAGDEI
jgi:hypothetical protein